MKLTPEEQLLADSLDDEMPDDALAVVDWRAYFDEIVDEFARFLPEGYVTLEEASDGRRLELRTKYAAAQVPLTEQPPFGLDVGAAIASILPPDFEARALSDSLDSDTHCYFVRPRTWWDQFRAAFPEQYRRIFADPSALPDRFVAGDNPPAQGSS